MKILFFIESLYQGGRERQLVELLKQITKNPDFQCELVIMRKDIFFREINDLNIKIHIIERKYFRKDPLVFFKFYNVAKLFNPDIVHVWGNMTAVYSLLAKLLLGFKLVNFQIRDAPLKPRFSPLNRKITFHFSDIILANSSAGLKVYNPPPNKSKVIHNGFDLDRITNLKSKKYIRNEFNITTKYVIGMVGRFNNDKDYATYIEAANLILHNRFDITFLCFGRGESEEYKKLVEPGYSDKIKLLPPQNGIESIMNICDIGILATFSEGISNVLMEFMALGKPVIATDGGGTKELVINGETGYLIPPKSPEILAGKIQYLLDNSDIAEKQGVQGRKRLKRSFNIEKMVNEFVSIYNTIIYR